MSETVLILGVGVAAGIGAAVARKFAGAGYHVMIAGRTLEKLDATAADISAAGGSIESILADVTSQEDQHRVFEIVRARKEPVSAVIYNAGSNLPIKFSDLSPELFEDFWRIGCFGAFLTSRLALPLLSEQGKGSLLFTGASASVRGRPNFAHFAVAKAGLRNLAQALARPRKRHG